MLFVHQQATEALAVIDERPVSLPVDPEAAAAFPSVLRALVTAADQRDEAVFLADGSAVKAEWLSGKTTIGVTAGASAPDVLVQAVIDRLRALGATTVRSLPGVEEHVRFPLPMGLGDKSMAEVSASRS